MENTFQQELQDIQEIDSLIKHDGVLRYQPNEYIITLVKGQSTRELIKKFNIIFVGKETEGIYLHVQSKVQEE